MPVWQPPGQSRLKIKNAAHTFWLGGPSWADLIAARVDGSRFSCEYGALNVEDLEQFDCVVPLSLKDYKVLQGKMELWSSYFWSPTPYIVDICDDKLALNRLLLGGKFAELIPPLIESDNRPFPYIVKKRRDEWGENSFVVWTSEDERAIAPLIQSSEYFCQSCILGVEEFALHMLIVNGELAYGQTVKYEMDRDVFIRGKKVNSIRNAYLPDSEHTAVFLRLMKALDYTGTCCIDYKIDNDVPKLLEINPRFGGSLIGDVNRYLEVYLRTLVRPPH